MTGDLNAATVQKPKFSLWAIALTLCIAVLNIVVYFYQLNYAAPLDSQENNLLLFGANVYQLSLTGDWWRYPVSMVLHSGGMHLALNTLVACLLLGLNANVTMGNLECSRYTYFQVSELPFSALIGNIKKH